MSRSRPCLAEPPAESPSTMNSSLSSGLVRGAVGQLAGEVQPVAHRGLAGDLACEAARLASRARAARMIRATTRLGHRLVVVEPLLQRRADHVVDQPRHLGVVQPPLGLPLELRLDDVDGEDGGHPLADVLRGERHALGREVVRLDVVPDGLHQARAQARLVGAAVGGGDAVDVAADVLVGGLGPGQGQLQPRLLAGDVERRGAGGHQRLAPLLGRPWPGSRRCRRRACSGPRPRARRSRRGRPPPCPCGGRSWPPAARGSARGRSAASPRRSPGRA